MFGRAQQPGGGERGDARASCNRAEVLAAVSAVAAAFVAKQTVVCCTRERFCLFSKIWGFILGILLPVSVRDFIFLDACDGKRELIPNPLPSSFSSPSHCFLF